MRRYPEELFRKVFKHEEINGAGRCDTYLHRWTLLRLWGGMVVYLHHFVGSDWSRDHHDHPKRFISIGLWGSYHEEHGGSPPNAPHVRRYRAPWVRTFPAEHVHRIVLKDGETAWTLVIALRAHREWGFWRPRPFGGGWSWVPWRKYIRSSRADEAMDC